MILDHVSDFEEYRRSVKTDAQFNLGEPSCDRYTNFTMKRCIFVRVLRKLTDAPTGRWYAEGARRAMMTKSTAAVASTNGNARRDVLH